MSSPSTPVFLVLQIDKPGSVPTARLSPLAPPAAGAPVQAKMTIVASGRKGKRQAPGTSVSAAPGSSVEVIVHAATGSPANATLRIAIPKTSGKSIAIDAGGTAQSPSSTGTINSSGGSIRISGLSYSCQLPPATFCPVAVKETNTGLRMKMSTPQVIVVFSVKIAAA